MVTFYDDAIFVYTYFKIKIVYVIIGRHAYHDVRALHGQLVMYVSKHFIHQCLLYVRVTQRHTMNFHIIMIIPVQLHKIT